MTPFTQTENIWKCVIVIVDILFLNLLYTAMTLLGTLPQIEHGYVLCNLSYIVSICFLPPRAQKVFLRAEHVAARVLRSMTLFVVIFAILVLLLHEMEEPVSPWWYPLDWLILMLTIFLGRTLTRQIMKRFRMAGAQSRRVIFLGAGNNLRYLYDTLTHEYVTGFRVKGYFDNHSENKFTDVLPRLGGVQDLIPYLKKQPVDIIFCNLTSNHEQEILEVMNYCENHLIRFYSVPNVRNYVHHVMSVENLGNMPVLTLREEPLTRPRNKFMKRAFDIVFSLTFLLTLFPFILIFAAIGIKISSPGPIFFRQKRTGLNGKDFYCLKFRSMHINKEADTLQATENDPRKFPFGDFLRRTNIDEMPQFINVLLGDMSVVGPRPHMLKHTDEYGHLIDKYMVRHWAKPGITGWAQINGARGETEHLWQMEKRINLDVWYIENYSFMLDIRIIFGTIIKSLRHDDQAY